LKEEPGRNAGYRPALAPGIKEKADGTKAEANIKAQEEDTMTKQKFTVDDALRIYDNEGLVGVVEAVKRIKDAEFKKEKALMFNPDWKPDVQAILKEHNEAVAQIKADYQAKLNDLVFELGEVVIKACQSHKAIQLSLKTVTRKLAGLQD